jgi:hypothetical protein
LHVSLLGEVMSVHVPATGTMVDERARRPVPALSHSLPLIALA